MLLLLLLLLPLLHPLLLPAAVVVAVLSYVAFFGQRSEEDNVGYSKDAKPGISPSLSLAL